MRFHHMMIQVSDMDEAVKFWHDFLGFTVNVDMTIPHEGLISQETCDELFGKPNSQSRQVLLTSDEGALIELQQLLNPAVQVLPPALNSYGFSGITELCLMVEDSEALLKRALDAGYKTNSTKVTDLGIGKSFLLYDPDGNIIQIWEQAPQLGPNPTWGM